MNNWLDKYEQGGLVLKQKTKDNYGKKANPNNPDVKLPPGFKGLAYNTKGRNYSPAWGGQFEDGGNIAQKGMAVPTTADSARLFNAQTALNNFYAKEMKAGRIKKGAEAKSMAGNPYYSFPNKLRELNEENLDFYRIEIRDRIKHKGGADDDYYKDYFNLSPEKVRNLENTGLAMTKSGSEYQQYYRDLITPMQNLAAPFALVDSRILPQRTINYESTVPAYPGGNVMVYDYDPLAIKPYHMRTDKEKIEWEKKYGKGTPITSSTKKPTTSTEKSKTAPEKKKTSVVKKSEETKPTKTEETKPTPYTPKGSKKYIVNGVEVSEEDFLGLDNTTGGSKRIIYSTPKLGSQKVLRLDGTPETDPEKIRKAMRAQEKDDEFQYGGSIIPTSREAYDAFSKEYNEFYTTKVPYLPKRDDGFDDFEKYKTKDLKQVPRSQGSGWLIKNDDGEMFEPSEKGEPMPKKLQKKPGTKTFVEDYIMMRDNPMEQYYNSLLLNLVRKNAKTKYAMLPSYESLQDGGNLMPAMAGANQTMPMYQMGGSIPGAVGFTYARVAGSAPSNGKYAKKTKASAQDGKVVQEKRHSNLYSPIESKIDAAIKSYDEYYNLPGSTQRFIDRYVKASPSVYDVRNIPPVDPVISEVQQKIQGLSNKEVNKLLHTDWSKMGIVGAMKNTPSNVSYPEMLKYISHFNKLKKKGYTFQNGGDMKYYQEGLDFKPKTISQDGSEIPVDPMGYWNPENIGNPVIIPSTDITMEGVDQPLIGISDTGDVQYMEPGEDYEFEGEYVTEYPVAKKGISVNNADAQPIKKLDQLLNFTNYNKPTKGGWLSKYQYGGGVLSRSNLETMAALEKDIKNQKARNAQETVSQYTSKPRDQQRMNAAKDAYRAEEAKPLNRAASSRVAAKAMENIVEPMLAIETGMGAGKLVKPALETAGKYLTEKTALKNAYKINPWAETLEGQTQRQIFGDPAYESFLKHGPTTQPEVAVEDQISQWLKLNRESSAVPVTRTGENMQIAGTTRINNKGMREGVDYPFAYFSEGSPWYGPKRSASMAESLGTERRIVPKSDKNLFFYPAGETSIVTNPDELLQSTIQNYAGRRRVLSPFADAFNPEAFDIYEGKPHWLKGYKKVPKKEKGGWLNKYK